MAGLLLHAVAATLSLSGLSLLALGCPAMAGVVLAAAPTWTVMALCSEDDEDE